MVGRDQMRDQNAQSVVEALRYTAGVSVNSNPNDNRFETLRIRGFEPVIYLDGMQLPYGTGLFGRPKVDPFMLERIEVLKGPSSSLYGQIAPGGLINLVSLLPPSTPIRTVEVQANTFGRGQAAFDVGGPVGPRRISLSCHWDDPCWRHANRPRRRFPGRDRAVDDIFV